MAAAFILSLLCKMRAYEPGETGFSVGLGWHCYHTMIVISDDREGLHWFLFAMYCTRPVWASVVWSWRPLGGTSLIQPMATNGKAKEGNTGHRPC